MYFMYSSIFLASILGLWICHASRPISANRFIALVKSSSMFSFSSLARNSFIRLSSSGSTVIDLLMVSFM